MCFVWEGKIEKCQNCSETDFKKVVRAVWNVELGRPIDQLIPRAVQGPLNADQAQSSRHDSQIDLRKDLTAENTCSHAQDQTHQAQPSSSRHDYPIDQAVHNKRRKPEAEQHSSSTRNAEAAWAARHERQGKSEVQASSRQGARHVGMVQSGQHAEYASASSSGNSRTDWAHARHPKESRTDTRSSSRRHAITDLTSDHGHEERSQKVSQTHSRAEETEDFTAGMNKLPLPCWEDEQFFHPVVHEQLSHEEALEGQEQRLADIWGPYGNEREALAAFPQPEMEETWTPDFENEEILERTRSLEEEIWQHSVIDGESSMRDILEEEDSWPQAPPEDAGIWTRENGGMLSSGALKRLSRVLNFQESMTEEEQP